MSSYAYIPHEINKEMCWIYKNFRLFSVNVTLRDKKQTCKWTWIWIIIIIEFITHQFCWHNIC